MSDITIYRIIIETPGQQHIMLFDYKTTVNEAIVNAQRILGPLHVTDVFPALGIPPKPTTVEEASVAMRIRALNPMYVVLDRVLSVRCKNGSETLIPEGTRIRYWNLCSVLAEPIDWDQN